MLGLDVVMIEVGLGSGIKRAWSLGVCIGAKEVSNKGESIAPSSPILATCQVTCWQLSVLLHPVGQQWPLGH